MYSKIYQSDRVMNQTHEFGETDAHRYPALFVRDDGTESVILLTPNQVAEAEKRGAREEEDVAVFLEQIQRRERDRSVRIVSSVAIFVAVFGTLSAILAWGSP